MHKLSETIERKFIDSIDISEWEIETDDGWTDITHIHQTIEYEVFEIETESGLKLEAADTHILFDENLNEIFLQDVLNKNIYTKNGPDKVIKLIKHNKKENMFDLTVSNENHRYYTNDILSHNTETFRIFLTHYILFNEYKSVGILANKEDTAIEILGKIQYSFQALPTWLQMGVEEFNKSSFVLENGCRIIAGATSSDAVRGYTFHVVILDEAAHIENWEEFYSSVYPTISAGKTTKLIMVSTPNGLNHFYDFWKGSIDGKNDFNRIFVPWYDVPGRNEKWKINTLRGMNGNLEKFAQEYSVEFLGSSGTLIAGWKLKELVGSDKEPLKESNEVNLKIFEHPIKNSPQHNYAIIADVSRGKGLDYSAFSVIDITDLPYRQVATFRDNQIAPADYADIIYKTALIYNNALVLTEINDIGEQVGYLLMIEYGYEHVLCTENAGKAGKKITFGSKKSDRGIRTTKVVKGVGCQILKLLIEQNKFIVSDKETINEFTTFSRQKDSYAAEAGKHDDMIMGLVLFAWLTDQSYFREATDINTTALLRERTSDQINDSMMPFGFDESSLRKIEAYREFYKETNMNTPVPQFNNENVGKKEVFDNCVWEYSEFKQTFW